MTYDYLVHAKYVGGNLSTIYNLKKPITQKDLEWIANNLSIERGEKVIIVSFSPFPPSFLCTQDSKGVDRIFLVRNVTKGEVVEFSIRSEAEEYYDMVTSLHGYLYEYEFVARIKHHLPSETLS
jgi:hypothetical protein